LIYDLPNLVETTRGAGYLVDASSTRLLYLNQLEFFIRDRVTGADTRLGKPELTCTVGIAYQATREAASGSTMAT
jgi:hypothetical protein